MSYVVLFRWLYIYICIKAVVDLLPRVGKRERANLSAIVYL